MRALYLDAQRPIESKLYDPSSSQNVGSAVVTIARQLEKPAREFSIKSWDQLLREQIETIRNEIHASRITGVFWFDGDQWGDLTQPIYIGQGNGSQLHFPMPFDNVFAPSWKIWVDKTLNTNWTMAENSGTLIFGSAPTGRISGLGKRKFRVVMADTDALMSEAQILKAEDEGVFTMEPIVLREVQAVSTT